MLTPQQFGRLRHLASSLAGLELEERHAELIHRRWLRLGLDQGDGCDRLLSSAESGDPVARRRLIPLLTTGHTAFFRHPQHFVLAAEHTLWALHLRGAARLWSTAASTGEEPYSLAMGLLETLGGRVRNVSLLATDINEDALDIARRGEYGASILSPIEPRMQARFLRPAAPDFSGWRVTDEVRNLVSFRTLNLAELDWHVEGPFDVLFCRNILMYLEAGHRYAVAERLASLLAPDGILLLDPAEHLGPAGHLFQGGREGVYSLRPLRAPSLRPHTHLHPLAV